MKKLCGGGALFTIPIILIILSFASIALSQVSDKVLSVKTSTGIEGQPLTISAELTSTAKVSQVLLAYRLTGSSEYRQIEATLTGTTASATLQGNEVTPLGIEYFFILKIQGRDSVETYTFPTENPANNPLRVDVQGAGGGGNRTVIFLSPSPGVNERLSDLLISISLINVDSTVDRKATKMIIDDRDVSKFAVVSEDLITLVPENVDPPMQDGPHNVRVELYKTDGTLFYKTNQSFTQVSAAATEKAQTGWHYNISGQAEARNENLQSVSTNYDRAGLNASASYGVLNLNGKAYVTNEDKDDRQPQNRFLIEGKTPWLSASYGDAYPSFPSLIMSGKRVRGTTADLTLGGFNLSYANGEITRSVQGDTVFTVKKSSLFSDPSFDPNGAYVRYSPDDSIWAKVRYGTYKRTLTAIRPSFGNGNHFQWGFTYLKSKDDVNSILYGTKPQENLAVGSDMTIAADNKNFLITAQGAASIRNLDISKGSLNDAQIDTLFKGSDSTTKREDLKKIRDKISPYMTVNENVVPLSTSKISSIMAGEGALSLNYFGNFFKAGYIFRGSQYASFGQTFLRNDVKGYNIYDRVRLVQNQVFVSGSIEHLEDNLDASKIATTTFSNLNATISYFPRVNFPNITIGYGKNTSSNGLNSTTIRDTTGMAADSSIRQGVYLDSTRLKNAIEDATTRIFFQIGYDLHAGGLRHNLSLNVSTSSRDDKTLQQMNTQNTMISVAVTTSWNSPLQTGVGLTENLNKNPIPTWSGKGLPTPATIVDYNYTTLLLSARYGLMENKLHLNGMFGPTFGDFSRTLWDASADYLLMKNVTAVADFSILQNPGFSTDAIWSLVLKYNM